jgi:hypothetical protein
MNYGLALIAKILDTQDINKALRAGAKSPGLLGAEAKMYFDIISEHHAKYHEVPSIELFRERVPGYHHVPTQDSVEALIDQLKTIRLTNEMEDIISKVARIGASDPWNAKTELLKLVEGLSTRHSKNNNYYTLGEDADETMSMLKMLREQNGLIGLPWPWEYFNQVSRGVCNGEIYYIYGRQKSRKTFLLLFIALYYWALGLKVLIFTREMSFEELKWRLLALQCNFDYTDTVKNQLPPGSEEKIERFLREANESGKLVITDVGDGINGFQAAVDDVNPDIIIHDYFKAMADDAMGEKVNGQERYVARTIDRLVDFISGKAKVPMFICGHANREGARTRGRSSTEHAWSDHITRRIHGALRVITHEPTNRMALYVNAGRSLEQGIGMTLNAKLCVDFGRMLSTDYSWVGSVDNDEDANQQRGNRGNGSQSQQQQQPQESASGHSADVIDMSSFA